ncbi:MAG: hypothetical protein ABIL06_09740 [Pseudomonadota bacterium]
MAYMIKEIFTINSASSANFGVATSTRNYTGTLERVEYSQSSSPFIAASSGKFLVRRGSTSGAILCKSSSALAATVRSYSPRGTVIACSGLSSSGIRAEIPLASDSLKIIRAAASSDGGNLLGCVVTCFIKGADQY